MRDGTITYADVVRPDAPGRFAALLTRTPYDRTSSANISAPIHALQAARNGWAVVIQDVRGRFASEGVFRPFHQEIDDGYDSVEWVGAQEWCTGKVGMHGISYGGATQWLAALAKPPSLVALAPGYTATDYHDGWAWQGGAFELGFNLSWAMGALTHAMWPKLTSELGLSSADEDRFVKIKDDQDAAFGRMPLADQPQLEGLADYFFEWLAHPEYDDYWQSVCIEDRLSEIDLPTLNYGGWYDVFMGGTIRGYEGMKARAPSPDTRDAQRLLVGPWVHIRNCPGNVGAYDFGTRAGAYDLGLEAKLLRFFDHHLRGAPAPEEGPVEVFTMGENRWQTYAEWPPSGAVEKKLYFHSEGRAATCLDCGTLSFDAPGSEPADAYVYNPADPTPTVGGGLCCDPVWMKWGPYDQRDVEKRPDVLVFSSEPLDADLEITGWVRAKLFAATTAVDTDFTAKLVDVAPDGDARNLTDGILRARYRNGRGPAQPVTPGEVIEYDIDMWATSNVFKAGHQIRVEISSSNFPRFDRNPNTGGDIATETEMVPALQTIYHDTERPSHITVSVVSR
jgi:putative CocE/NonD family hydrolase